LEVDPRGVDPSEFAFDTRKTVDQTQAGLIYERRLNAANALRLTTSVVSQRRTSSGCFAAVAVSGRWRLYSRSCPVCSRSARQRHRGPKTAVRGTADFLFS
jgi:hypothetical protein